MPQRNASLSSSSQARPEGFATPHETQATALTPARIVQLGNAFREAKALLSAVELGVFATLANGPLELDALRKRIDIHGRGARDFFDALVALGLLDRDTDGRYTNVPAADLYLVPGRPTYIGGLLEHMSVNEYPRWNFLTRALQSGEPQTTAKSAGLYPVLYANQESLNAFVGGMSGGSLLVGKALAAKFPWERHRTLIDVGSAEGCLPVQIAQSHAHITGGGFDLPAVGPAFETYVRGHGLADWLRFHPGDFLIDSLPAADVLVMGRVLHNWDLATKKMLLDKAFAALQPDGVLIVYERLIDDERRTSSIGLLASLNMLLMTDGGFDFTGADCASWMQEVGFHNVRVEPLTADQSMITGVK